MLWAFAVAVFVAGAAYAVGGRAFVRGLLQARARAAASIEATLEPPSQAEVQRSAPDTTGRGTPASGPPPVSVVVMAVWIGGIITVVTVAFFVTGRGPGRRA